MWLFDKIKKMLDKSIAMQEEDKTNLITYVKLKGATLKIGQEITVDTGYNLVSVYYNHFCDVLGEGKHKLDEATLPRMYRLFYNLKRKKDEEISNKIEDADLYFIKLSEMKLFVRTGKICFMSNGEKVKARLKCDIKYDICDVAKFMDYFAEEFAILKNDKVVEEIQYFLKEKIENFLYKTDFDGLFLKKEEVERMLLSKLQELKNDLGIEVKEISIKDVEVPKKYLGKKIVAKNKLEASEEIIKLAENSINGVQEEQKVSVGVGRDRINGENGNQDLREKDVNFQKGDALKETTNSNSFASCDDIMDKVNKSQDSLNKDYDLNIGGSEPYKISNAPQNAPNLFEESKKEEPKKEPIEESKVVTKYKIVVKCPCCGAKNEENAEYCMVCKSKL